MVRPATAADVLGLLAVEVECFGTSAWGAPSLESAIADPHQDVLVTAAGSAYGVVRVSGDTADLDRIAVRPEVRRRGVARGLLVSLTDRAVERGAQRMLLEVAADNAAAIALYTSMDFVRIHRRERYYAGGADALVLERSLAD